MPRQPKGFNKIYFSNYDKLWHCWVTVGTKPNGEPDRKNVRGETATECGDKVKELLKRVEQGNGIPSKIETVGHWLPYWVEYVAKGEIEFKTYQSYEGIIRLHLVPLLGGWKLDGLGDRLEPKHVLAAYETLKTGGPKRRKLALSYVRQCHVVLNRALADAVVQGYASRNVCSLIRGPKGGGRRRVKSHTMKEIQAIIEAALTDPLAERWLIAMLLGLRQGEALAFRWDKVDLDEAVPGIRVDEQLQRQTWAHGCGDPAACVLDRKDKSGQPKSPCRRRACPPKFRHGCDNEAGCKAFAHFCPKRRRDKGCNTHRGRDGCPPLCAPDCRSHASTCPDRVGGGMVAKAVKSEDGERVVPLFPFIVDMLRARREEQIRRGIFAEDGLVFRGPTGNAIDSRRDHEAWEALLRKAGVADSRLHAARHTAGTLLATQADIAVVQEILGHADIRMTRQYVDVAKELKQAAVENIAAAVLDGNLMALLQPRVQPQRSSTRD